MTQILRIPKVAVSMREGTLVAWLAEDGALVAERQPLFTLELEKSTMDVESPAAGVLRHKGQAGVTYKVGEIIGEISAPVPQALPEPGAVAGSLQRLVQVVGDLDQSIQAWATATGAGPFFLFPHMGLKDCDYRGTSVAPDVSVAIAACGDMLVELVQLHDATPSAWRDAGPGAMIPAVTVDDLSVALELEADSGAVRSFGGAFQFGGKFAFVEPASPGPRLMLVEKHFVGSQITDRIRAAHRNWDRSSLVGQLK
jgi:pyruvate/2-oxoglutarate dehydrogenase complex dihydrolipoamide acyltransferase (E2) component